MTHESELRATSDLMLEMLERLRRAEDAKRALTPGTAEFARMAWDVLELARTVTRWSELQLRQANEFLADGKADAPLEAAPKRRLDAVLAEWRQSEIRLSHAPPGSSQAIIAAADADRLREEYRELQDRKLADHQAS
jgi:hypothetical protein